jgi:hypothetical protein
LQGFGRAQRQRVSGAEDAGSVGVCLPGANNVMSRTLLRQDARTISRSLARSLPLSLSLSLSLSLQMFRAIVDAGCRTTPPRMLCLECSACACVCALSCAVINYLHPPLECSVLLCMRMRMLENALSFY